MKKTPVTIETSHFLMQQNKERNEIVNILVDDSYFG